MANTRYWLLVDRTAGSFAWLANLQGRNPSSNLGVVFEGYQSSINNGVSYSTNATTPSLFQINVTLVPTSIPFEFNPALGIGAIGGFYLVQKRLKKKKSTKD